MSVKIKKKHPGGFSTSTTKKFKYYSTEPDCSEE